MTQENEQAGCVGQGLSYLCSDSNISLHFTTPNSHQLSPPLPEQKKVSASIKEEIDEVSFIVVIKLPLGLEAFAKAYLIVK